MPRRVSDLERYCKAVGAGKIVACEKTKKLCSWLLNEMRRKDSRWKFDIRKAERPVQFIERFCKVPSGRIGRPLQLELFQKAWIESIFGFVDRETGMRRFTEALILMGRKNGKTTLASAVELFMLVGDGEGSPQVYNVANKLDQADLGYKAACKMVRQSGDLSKHIRKTADRLSCDINMGYIMPLGSNSATLDGLDVHCAIVDEIHAAKTREVLDLMVQGTAAREQPLILEITTNGFVRDALFDAQYERATKWLDGEIEDDRFIPWVYELDDRAEWEDESCWAKANPGLGTIKKMEYLRSQVERAHNDPTYLPTVLTKDFNLPENAAVAWLSYAEAVNVRTFDLREMGFRYGIVGFDAADTVDLTAAQMLMMRRDDPCIYEHGMYWLPEDVLSGTLNDGFTNDRDSVPYAKWMARGLMRTFPGNKVDKKVLVDFILEMRDVYDVYTYAVCFDPWHIDDSLRRDLAQLVGESRVIPVRQGALTLSQPMKQIRADYKAGVIVDNHNPVNEFCRMNVEIRTDINGNIQPFKKKSDPRNRIDGFMAELDAYIGLANLRDDYLTYV